MSLLDLILIFDSLMRVSLTAVPPMLRKVGAAITPGVKKIKEMRFKILFIH